MDEQNNYLSNISDFNDLDEEIIQKNEKLEIDNENLEKELSDLKKDYVS